MQARDGFIKAGLHKGPARRVDRQMWITKNDQPLVSAVRACHRFDLALMQCGEKSIPSLVAEEEKIKTDIGVDDDAIRYHVKHFFVLETFMLFVLSPAKTLNYDTPAPTEEITLPDFMAHSAELIKVLQAFSPAQIAELMRISDPLASLNFSRYASWSPLCSKDNAKQAVFSFNGDVYEGLDAVTLDDVSLKYAQSRIRFLSGLYGLLRPLDLMQPYRLEMGTRLKTARARNLYEFWGDTITEALNALLEKEAVRIVVNLASEEYFRAVKPSMLNASVVTPVFQEWKGGGYKIISFHAKRARGLMARFAALHRIDDPQRLTEFNLEGYSFAQSASTETELVFRRRSPD